jgi:hypothetical protein
MVGETSDDTAVAGGLIADVAALARQLVETAPFTSLSGPDALRALAARLDAMVAPAPGAQPDIVRVAVRRRARNLPDRRPAPHG